MLPFYLRHYREVATKFFILDDSSNDGSTEYLRAQPDVELGSFHKDHDSLVLAAQRFYNENWKQSRGAADWVIICNIDEHLYHPRLADYLATEKSRGVTVIPAKGFQMITEDFPAAHERLSETRRRGMPWAKMDKLSIFDPNAIDEIAYTVGRHTAAPRGRVLAPSTLEMKLLHYKYLGLEYLVRRLAELRTGLRAQDIANRWGHKYLWSTAEVERDFATVRSNAIDVMTADGG